MRKVYNFNTKWAFYKEATEEHKRNATKMVLGFITSYLE